MHFSKIALACALSLSTAAVLADSSIPVTVFAKHAEYRGAQLSPTGEYVSVVTPYEDRHGLSIIKLSGNYDRSLIKFDVKETIAGSYWTADNRIVVFKARDLGFLEEPIPTGDVYAANADGSDQEQLFGYLPDRGNIRSQFKDEGQTSFVGLIGGGKGEALFYFRPYGTGNSDTASSVFRVDTRTGSRRQVDTIPGGDVVADHSGVVRFNYGSYASGEPYQQYRARAGEAWREVPKSIAGYRITPLQFDTDNNHVYATISDKGEPAALYRVDLAAGTRERLAGNADIDISRVLYAGENGAPFAVVYNPGKPKIDYIDPTAELAKLHAGLMKLFPGQLVEIVNFTDDGNKFLFLVHSDRHPGAYYVFDRKSMQPQMLFEVADWIDPAKMAPTRPIEFANAGGTKLYGLYTAPLGKQGPQPMVVLPHGGPYGLHDAWEYNAEVQFLASRGYGVLQVNYRGSGGRGESFERSTYQQWGTGIQADIADGVRWAIAQNLADAKKICISGGSFGGYSAAMNPILNPSMYRCAIAYAGVFNLDERYKDGNASYSVQGREALKRTMGEPGSELLKTQSPNLRAAELNVPILIIHGTTDHTVPVDHARMMEAALKKAGKTYETFIVPDEGHGFYKEENQAEAFRRMEAFLRKYNPAD